MAVDSHSGFEVVWQHSLIIAGLLVFSAQAAFGVCPIEDWSAETRESSDLAALHGVSEDGVDGIGGSGLVPGSGEGEGEDGIGGSGIFGTVTGFGSLCVNGGRVIYDESAVLSLDGKPGMGDFSALVVGQVVRVKTKRDSGESLRATAIDVQHELLGPVTDVSEGLLEVMGESLEVAGMPSVLLGEIKIGSRVAVSGLRRPNGLLVVSRIDSAPDHASDHIRGEVHRRDVGPPGVGAIGLTSLGRGTLPDEAIAALNDSVGKGRQFIRGRWNNERNRFEVFEMTASPMASVSGHAIDIEGYVIEASKLTFRIGDLTFRSDEALGTLAIEVGDRVRVRGVRGGDGRSLRVISVSQVPEQRLIRSLNRDWRAPDLVRPDIERERLPHSPDHGPRPHRAERLERHDRPERLGRPDRHERPQPRHDLLPPRIMDDVML